MMEAVENEENTAMATTKKKKKKQAETAKLIVLLTCMALLIAALGFLMFGESGQPKTDDITHGIDVSRYQGTIDWAQVANDGIDFAIVRLGYRSLTEGTITEDPTARYNLQEASKHGISLGAYFFSTAVTAEEAREEARWAAELLAQYPITYPVAYNCEGFGDEENRHAQLSVAERTDLALEFLREIEDLGYEAMFYASKNEMEGDILWEVSRIEPHFPVWVAQYPETPYPETEQSDYSRTHVMWQYTRTGRVAGIDGDVDRNIAYFGYAQTAVPHSTEPPETVGPHAEAEMTFTEVWEHVTAKEQTNLRDYPSQDALSQVCRTLQNGEVAMRTGVSESGWSRLVYEGVTYYAVSSLLSTDLEYQPTEDDGIETEFFTKNDRVTAKDAVNLRTLPSVTDPEAKVVVKLRHGEVVQRTGINEDVGWSRVVWQGQTLYCVTSYLETVEE